MAGRKAQRAYFSKRWSALEGFLNDTERGGDAEALHQLRVQIKKLRAVLDVYGNPVKKKELAPLKALFREAGLVRSAGIHLDLLRKLHAPDAQLRSQAIAHARLLKSFRDHIPEHRKKLNGIYGSLKAQLNGLTDSALSWQFLECLDRAAARLTDDTPETSWHEARKQIKLLLYAGALADNRVGEKLQLNVKYLNRLQELIGEWHDTEATHTWLESAGMGRPAIMRQLLRSRNEQAMKVRQEAAGLSAQALLPVRTAKQK